MDKPRLLDLFCGAGGATKGYQRAGFYVVGVDIKPQPHYCGDEFHQGDALTYPLDGFDAYHASPPCQFASEAVPKIYRIKTPNLIGDIRNRLEIINKPYVIENVDNARIFLKSPIRLHGSMFGLKVHRSRWFEIYPENLMVLFLKPYPTPNAVLPTGHSNKRVNGKRIPCNRINEIREAMGIPWANGRELSEAIPPAYTEYIGKYLMQVVNSLAVPDKGEK